jgi:hypothetical protein
LISLFKTVLDHRGLLALRLNLLEIAPLAFLGQARLEDEANDIKEIREDIVRGLHA